MRITRQEVMFWILVGVPSAVILCWLLLVLLWLEVCRLCRRLVTWLFAEEYPPKPAPARPSDTGRRRNGSCCCGHRKAVHENGADGCVAEGCDCRGFAPPRNG